MVRKMCGVLVGYMSHHGNAVINGAVSATASMLFGNSIASKLSSMQNLHLGMSVQQALPIYASCEWVCITKTRRSLSSSKLNCPRQPVKRTWWNYAQTRAQRSCLSVQCRSCHS